jgi:hypothetical protein
MSMYTICKGWLTNSVNIPTIYEVFIISDHGLSVKNKPQITLTLDFIMLLKIIVCQSYLLQNSTDTFPVFL